MSSITSPVSSAARTGRWVRVAATLILLDVALIVLLQVILISEGSSPIPPMVIIGVLALAVGIALLARPTRGLCIGAVILMAVNLAGAGPNEVANLTANALGHQLFGAASLLTIAGALGASVMAAVTFRQGSAS
jgi:hypothetical protein